MTTSVRADGVIEHLLEQLRRRSRSWVRVRTLAALAGQKRLSAKLIAELEQAMASAGIHHYPGELSTCLPTDTLLISTSPFRDPGLPFADEEELAAFVQRHYRHLPPFARCTSVVRQDPYQLDGRTVRVDLCFREHGGGRVVCELEHGTGRYETGSQVRTYIEAVASSMTGRTRAPKVRGVVVTGAPNPAQEAEVAKWCAESGVRVDWYYYRLAFELEPAPLHSG